MREYKSFKGLEIEEMMCLDGGAIEYETIDTRYWEQWFSNLFEVFTP